MVSASCLLLVIVAAAKAFAAQDFDFLLAGFSSGATLSRSSAGKAICASGNVFVGITSTNVKIVFDSPRNNIEATEDLQELLGNNPSIYVQSNDGPNVVSAKYRIAARLCCPNSDPKSIKTVQLVTHGLILDQNYWDIPGYSYVDAAASAGYATLAYDRLGSGDSNHPDPLQVVQLPAQVEIAHGLARMLRAGTLGGRAFSKVVGVGHSFGSLITSATTAKYPHDLDAAVLTGYSRNFTYNALAMAALDLQIANTQSSRFKGLANGYVVPTTPQGVQFGFWRWPFYAQSVFDALYRNIQTIAFGEAFTLGPGPIVASNYTGPVDIVLGRNDVVYCGSDCAYPVDNAAATLSTVYPGASSGSRSALIDHTGHNINGHFGAASAYAQINAFLKANGL